MTVPNYSELLKYMTPEERAFVIKAVEADLKTVVWRPLPGPQSDAYYSTADVVGYGGAAGGGKTDLACGKTLTQHEKTMILRRVGTELTAIEDRLEDLLGSRDGYSGQKKIWRLPGRQIELASVPHAGDERGYQGRPHDLLVFDEAANFLESQVRFLMGWMRSVNPNQRCQTLLTFNPPTSQEGRWIIDFFAPWLKKNHPNRARPGELRYFGTVDGKDIEVPDKTPFVIIDGKRVTDFDAQDYALEDIVVPLSRTFIPARVADNPYLAGTGYMNTLQALPEPLRSQMLYGDFTAGISEDPWQVIPTAWVEAAMERWEPRHKKTEMMGMGVDVARGGADNTIIYRKHEDMWFDTALVYPGEETPDGPKVAGLVIAASRDRAPIHIDIVGVGSSPYDFLNNASQPVYGINGGEGSIATDKSGRLGFTNKKSELWWKAREAFDPANNTGIAVPPDVQLLSDLTAPKWRLRGAKVCVETRKEIIERLGRSADWASAFINALIDTPKQEHLPGTHGGNQQTYDPYKDI